MQSIINIKIQKHMPRGKSLKKETEETLNSIKRMNLDLIENDELKQEVSKLQKLMEKIDIENQIRKLQQKLERLQ